MISWNLLDFGPKSNGGSNKVSFDNVGGSNIPTNLIIFDVANAAITPNYTHTESVSGSIKTVTLKDKTSSKTIIIEVPSTTNVKPTSQFNPDDAKYFGDSRVFFGSADEYEASLGLESNADSRSIDSSNADSRSIDSGGNVLGRSFNSRMLINQESQIEYFSESNIIEYQIEEDIEYETYVEENIEDVNLNDNSEEVVVEEVVVEEDINNLNGISLEDLLEEDKENPGNEKDSIQEENMEMLESSLLQDDKVEGLEDMYDLVSSEEDVEGIDSLLTTMQSINAEEGYTSKMDENDSMGYTLDEVEYAENSTNETGSMINQNKNKVNNSFGS